MITTTIKLSTLTGLVIILIDILLITTVMTIDDTVNAVKNAMGIANALLFSLSCTLYVFKLNQDIIKNDINNLFSYYWRSDLRVRGLEIIESIESIGLTQDEIWEFRDSILFRARLKHLSVILELLFLYYNAVAYSTIYYHTPSNITSVVEREEVYQLNLYISVISPILSIAFSYITVLCDNVVIVKDYVNAIKQNRDQEDQLLVLLKRVVRYPLLSVLISMEPEG